MSKAKLELIQRDMASLQFEVSKAVSADHGEEFREALMIRGVDSNYLALMALDTRGNIMESLRSEHKNLSDLQSIIGFDPKLLTNTSFL